MCVCVSRYQCQDPKFGSVCVYTQVRGHGPGKVPTLFLDKGEAGPAGWLCVRLSGNDM